MWDVGRHHCRAAKARASSSRLQVCDLGLLSWRMWDGGMPSTCAAQEHSAVDGCLGAWSRTRGPRDDAVAISVHHVYGTCNRRVTCKSVALRCAWTQKHKKTSMCRTNVDVHGESKRACGSDVVLGIKKSQNGSAVLVTLTGHEEDVARRAFVELRAELS